MNGGFMDQIEKMEMERDVEGLVNFLDHKDESFRAKAAKSLVHIRDVRAVEPLIKALYHTIRSEAAEALGIL